MTDALKVIEKQDWLMPAEESLQGALEDTFKAVDHGTRKVEDFLHGSWLGHPLHSAITDIPVGAWSTAAIFDLAGMDSAADAAVTIGLVGAVAAAVTGLTDWKDVRGKGRRAGLVHSMLNTVAAGLYVKSLFARRNAERSRGRRLAYTGLTVMLASAWLGGELVYKYGIGVDGPGKRAVFDR